MWWAEQSQRVRGRSISSSQSYDGPQIRRLYKDARSRRYSLSYSAGTRGRGSEIMFFADGVRIPRLKTPALIPTAFVDGRLAGTARG